MLRNILNLKHSNTYQHNTGTVSPEDSERLISYVVFERVNDHSFLDKQRYATQIPDVTFTFDSARFVLLLKWFQTRTASSS